MDNKNLKKDFDAVLKEVVAPIFKSLGFKKNGANFYRETAEIVQTFNFQKSHWNRESEFSFTGNIGFIVPNIYLKLHGLEELPKFPKCTDSLLQFRLGRITHGTDHWYKLTINSDLDVIKDSLSKDLREVVKLFESRKTIASIEDLIADRTNVNPFWGELGQFAYYKKIGKDKEAKEILETVYQKSQIPQSWVKSVEMVNGNWEQTDSKPKINKYWVEKIEEIAALYNEKLK